MSLLYFALGLIAVYVAIVTAMYVGQTWLLFPTALARMVRVQLPSSTQHLEVRTPDGESLKGIRTPSMEEAAQNAPTLLGFGGNAWNAKATALTLHRLFPDRDAVAFHYRGYAPTNGRPSAEALMSDSLAIFEFPATGTDRGTDRRGRVQHRLWRRRLSRPASTGCRINPGHSI